MEGTILANTGMNGLAVNEVRQIIEGKLPKILEAMRQSQPEQKETTPFLRAGVRLWAVYGNNSLCYFFELGKVRKPTLAEYILNDGWRAKRYLQISVGYDNSNMVVINAQHPTSAMKKVSEIIIESIIAAQDREVRMSSSPEFKSISVSDMQDEFIAQQGMEPSQAARKAIEEFPNKVAMLLDQGWEIITQDSTTVHLRKQ